MSCKAYFFQIDNNREQLEKFIQWIDIDNTAEGWIDYLFYSKKSPKGFWSKQNQITIAFTMDSSDFEDFPFDNYWEAMLLDELRDTPIHKDPRKWIDKNGFFFWNVDEAFNFIDSSV